jgi:hypothetical protein
LGLSVWPATASKKIRHRHSSLCALRLYYLHQVEMSGDEMMSNQDDDGFHELEDPVFACMPSSMVP